MSTPNDTDICGEVLEAVCTALNAFAEQKRIAAAKAVIDSSDIAAAVRLGEKVGAVEAHTLVATILADYRQQATR